MARNHANNGCIYRAVITTTYADGHTNTSTCGPYDTPAPAKAQISAAISRAEASHGKWRDQARAHSAVGHVESAEVAWGEHPAPQAPLHDFTPWPRISRLLRDVIVTEKIDGTNAAIAIRPLTATQYCPDGARYTSVGDQFYAVFTQSRTRIITPGKGTDNFGFAAWVWEHSSELASILGPGLHFGEWWGAGIQRGYGRSERIFSLFNADKYADLGAMVGDVPVTHVPVLYRGRFDTDAVEGCLADLALYGSIAAPGFATPEGLCVFHSASRQTFKITLDKNDAGKWEATA